MAVDLARLLTGGAASRPDSISGMDPAFSSALARMYAAAPAEVQAGIRIYSGYRSPETQRSLWENALRKYGSPAAARKWVAPPGRSNHNRGTAGDLRMNDAARKWVHANAAAYGLAFPMGWEPWHVELAGARNPTPTTDPFGVTKFRADASAAMPPAGATAAPAPAPDVRRRILGEVLAPGPYEEPVSGSAIPPGVVAPPVTAHSTEREYDPAVMAHRSAPVVSLAETAPVATTPGKEKDGMVKTVSFTTEGDTGATLASDQMLARRRAMADALLQRSLGAQRIEHPLQGVNQIAQAAVGGLVNIKADREERARRKAQVDALMGIIGPDAASLGISPEAIAANPDLAGRVAGAVLDKRLNPPEGPMWEEATVGGITGQRNKKTGEFKPFPGGGAAPTTTRPITEDERKAYGIPPGVPAGIDSTGKPVILKEAMTDAATKAPTPYTDAAKAKADLDAGLITPEQYQQAVSGAAGGGALFSGKSTEAEGLNWLVKNGVLTERQASEMAAGKTITGPNGEIIFMTPSGIFSAPAGKDAPAESLVRFPAGGGIEPASAPSPPSGPVPAGVGMPVPPPAAPVGSVPPGFDMGRFDEAGPRLGAPPAAPGPIAAPALVPAPAAPPPAAPPYREGMIPLTPPKTAGTEGQMAAGLYADRMAKSNEVVTRLEEAGLSLADKTFAGVPVIGNYLKSPEYRQLEQAQRDFINAVLRRESGAVISPDEFENARQQYFPQPGDDPATIEQKRANRATAIAGISRAAGPNYKAPAIAAPAPASASPVFDWSPDGGLRPSP